MSNGRKIDLVAVRRFAEERHAGQKWGALPYTVHLERVATAVQHWATFFNFSADDHTILIAAGWLHDVIEDTETIIDEVRSLAGDEVAQVVWRVTDEPGANRKERKAKTLPKIAGNDKAILVKLCDREINVENALQESPTGSYISMYRAEHASFSAALRTAGQYDALWEKLDKLLK